MTVLSKVLKYGAGFRLRTREKRVLYRVKEDRNIPYTIKRRKDNWICHVLSSNCLLGHIIGGKIRTKARTDGD
jgi:hypothetical protein